MFVVGPFGGDPLTLDLRHEKLDPHVNLILAIIAFAAEVESQTTRERVNGARALLLPTDRWVGGAPGYGYRIVKHPVKGKTIQSDEYAAGVIREIAGRLCEGESVTGIVQSLNKRGELTYRDHLRVLEEEWEAADQEGRRQLMLNAGMTLRIVSKTQFTLTIPASTMSAGFPGWEPHLSPADVTYIAGDSGATVDVEFTDDEPDAPAEAM